MVGFPHCSLVAVTIALACTSAAAQQVVKTGPPPAIRALVEEAVAALAGADAWEAFAQRRFSAELLKSRTVEQRKQLVERLLSDLGTVTLQSVARRGPDAPLQLNLKGSTGATGVLGLEVDASSPPRVTNVSFDIGSGVPEPIADGVPAPPINGSMSNDELNRVLDGFLAKLAANDVFAGVALIARNGVPVFTKAYGLADRDKKIPNTVRTRFNVGSINKTFTQAAINQLVRDGKLALTDTLGKFFPEHPQAVSKAATVQQLLDHRAGLADFFGSEFTRADKKRFRSNADYFRFVGTLPPTFSPGARNQYCNGCYIALGAIVEHVSGMPYEKYVAEHIFRRAEMTSTDYPHSDKPAADIAVGYTRRGGDGVLRSNVDMHGATGSAAGGGYSTAMDLLTYVKAVRAGRFPGADPNMGIAGGAPGTSAVVEAGNEWVVIVLTNFDPPTGERLGVAIMEALR